MGIVDPIPQSVVNTRARLGVKAVFFATIMYDQTKVVVLDDADWHGAKVTTACTDGRNIVVSQPFFDNLSIDERVFVLAHEIYHVMAMHPKRMRTYTMEGLCGAPFIPMLYNICADAIINKVLIDSAIGKCPKDCIDPEWMSRQVGFPITGNELPEELYEKLLEANDGQLKNQLIAAANSFRMNEDILPDSPDASAIDVNEGQMKAAIKSAMDASKAQGTMPAGIGRLISDILEPKVPWHEELREHVTRISGGFGTVTWSRPNRRKLVVPGVYIPKRAGLRIGTVVCAVDTSGSVSQHELNQFMGEVAGILADVKPTTVHVIWCDAKVDGSVEFDDPEQLKELKHTNEAKGGGGTSFIPPFEYVRDNQINPDVFIYLTDGYGPFPNEDLAPFPTIWVINNDDVTGPFGRTLRI